MAWIDMGETPLFVFGGESRLESRYCAQSLHVHVIYAHTQFLGPMNASLAYSARLAVSMHVSRWSALKLTFPSNWLGTHYHVYLLGRP